MNRPHGNPLFFPTGVGLEPLRPLCSPSFRPAELLRQKMVC